MIETNIYVQEGLHLLSNWGLISGIYLFLYNYKLWRTMSSGLEWRHALHHISIYRLDEEILLKNQLLKCFGNTQWLHIVGFVYENKI